MNFLPISKTKGGALVILCVAWLALVTSWMARSKKKERKKEREDLNQDFLLIY